MDNTKTLHNIGYNARIQIGDGVVTIDVLEGKSMEWREITFTNEEDIKKFKFLLDK